jgi:hypothetical protein
MIYTAPEHKLNFHVGWAKSLPTLLLIKEA